MTILAWYTLVVMTLGILATIANSKNSGGIRLVSTLFNIPTLIFALLYLLQ